MNRLAINITITTGSAELPPETIVNFHGLRVRCAPALAPLLGAFPRAPSDNDVGDVPDISIELAGATTPAVTDGFAPAFFHGDMRALERGGAFVLLHGDARVDLAADGRRIDVAAPTDALADRRFVDTTLFIALVVALRHHGLFHIHAGALVGGDGRRILVAGGSGAGKSTLTLSLLDATTRWLGDDALFVGARDGSPRLFAFPRPFHLGAATLAAFPQLSSRAVDERGKHIVDAGLPGTPIGDMAPPELALFPTITTEPTTEALPLEASETFARALHSSALVAVDGMCDQPGQLAMTRSLLARARGYEIRLGADALVRPRLIAELVSRLEAGG